MSSRRTFLKRVAMTTPAALAAHQAGMAQAHAREGARSTKKLLPNSIPVSTLPQHFDVETGIHNLENGYWSVMPRSVAQTYSEQIAFVNRTNSIWARNVLAGAACRAVGMREAGESIARMVGAGADEIAITRSGAEALQMLIANYKNINAGDAVIYCDLDYDDTIACMDWLGDHRGARVVRFNMPEPATTANILTAYQDILERTPHARLLLLTQVSNRTGLVTPVREIVAMARTKGVDTIVDIAHGVACLEFQIADLGCDFAGWSVHKWTSAPLGTGAMYIRKSRLQDIDIVYDDHDDPPDDIAARVPAGTLNFPAVLSIPAAAEFHFAVGASAKEKHLRSLRNRWVDQVRELPNVEICVPDDPARYCTITSFRLKGMVANEDAQRVQQVLFDKYRVQPSGGKGSPRGRLSASPRACTTHLQIVMRLLPHSTRNMPCSCDLALAHCTHPACNPRGEHGRIEIACSHNTLQERRKHDISSSRSNRLSALGKVCRKVFMTVTLLLFLPGRQSAAGQNSGEAATGSEKAQTVHIYFAGRLADKLFACGQTYEGIGSRKTTITPADLRFFVSDVKLLTAEGTAVPLTLEQDGVWQYQSLALIDLEDGTGACRNGNTAVHTEVSGTVPPGTYVGLRFNLGVPFELDHGDASSAPSPLNMTAMLWAWQNGYKCLRAEVMPAGQAAVEPAGKGMRKGAPGFPVHIGSNGCASKSPTTGPEQECVQPNRVVVNLATFHADTDEVVFDMGKLLSQSDLSTNAPNTSPGCMSFEGDPDCVGVMQALGIPYGNAPASSQAVFFTRAKQ